MEGQRLLEEKKVLRRAMKELRNSLSDKAGRDKHILSSLLQLPQVQQADTIYTYASYGSEAGTAELIQACLAMGKQVALPRVSGREMDFYRIKSMEDLQPGAYGIPEPGDGCSKIIPALRNSEKTCMILPGLAFDRTGHRLGYGGGYYDRYLERHPFQQESRIGLAYACQITECVPAEATDIPVGVIVTEEGAEACMTTERNEGCKMDLIQMGQKAKEAARKMNCMDTAVKNRGLLAAAKALVDSEAEILAANEKDVCNARAAGMSAPLVDRLQLSSARIRGMAEGLEQIAALEDPVGEVLSMWKRPNGLMIGQKRVPLGVIGIIYESRPNVTADAFGLCFKAGNAVILKGGSDAVYSNQAIVHIIQGALKAEKIDADCIQLITDTDRETTTQMMRMNAYIDVLIPRGGAGLIRAVVENATVPVIETGTGNCHVYVDETADFEMALNIIDNAKTQRTGVCNACESIIVHSGIADEFLKALADRLSPKAVEMRGDERAMAASQAIVPASEEDWGTEYLDLILSVKTVDSIEEAIAHINRYNTGHSESIVTKDYANAQKFLNEVDAAAVYVNASTRFTDGFEFGFGAEIGISTQKLHARGPMGLKELTSTKYIIYGNGQIR